LGCTPRGAPHLRHSELYLSLGGSETGLFIAVAVSAPSFLLVGLTTLVVATAKEVFLFLLESLLDEVAQAKLGEGREGRFVSPLASSPSEKRAWSISVRGPSQMVVPFSLVV
jgi:hypothetical protein